MAVRIALHHRTVYQYDRPVTLSPQVVRLRPAPHCRTAVESYALRVEPGGHFCNWQQDPFGNHQARLVFPRESDRLVVEVDLVAHLVTVNPFDFFLEEAAQRWGFAYPPELAADLAPYLVQREPGPRLRAWLAALPKAQERTIDELVALNRRVCQDVRYLVRLEPGVQSEEATLALGSGSCRDSAWLLVQALRQRGIAARFASGYLIQLVADEKPIDGPAGTEKDFTDLHAWCEAFLPGAGWVGLDPTSGLLCGEGHLPLACTPDPSSAAPITGSYAFAPRDEDDTVACDFAVTMSVTRLDQKARPTQPFSPAQWAAIDRLGALIDQDLADGDVRLTVGGEPTFVSSDDMEGAEWTTAALGPTKRRLAHDLLLRLRDRFAPGAFLHHGQGKWYPGEPLPRWALSAWWRADGEPLWRDPSRWADDGRPGRDGVAEAETFARALCAQLRVADRHLMPGFEDAWYHLWRERRLPVDVDPHDSRLDDPEERARLAKVFDRGLATPVGFALPLTRRAGRWATGPWFLRAERLYLLPGDSPMGFRLPLDALPWAALQDRIEAVEPDPFAPRQPLAPRAALTSPPPGQTARMYDGIVRTALCVEPRDGILRVFLPPLVDVGDFCALAAAIEDAAAATGLRVLCEGYPPPRDPRLTTLAVTPDPGVIEVNVHPAGSWPELRAITETVYAEARATRLRSDRFDLDGGHTGTGGGNHITLGGPSPADSPFLRRPDLLRSLLAYWHNHPALSYLFAGRFIGPTSQAPRPDEARHESVAELERALELIDRQDAPAPPWLVDRTLRHLLIDVTGNTHRTAISIDKLFSPDSASGRLGLVELRGFEMPPEPRMAMLTHALVRGLVARFWRQPYRRPLTRWGPRIHDRWMLPFHLREDLADVLVDLRQAGYPFAPEWFDAQEEFRFPRHGAITTQGVHLELRAAAEPWHVLGEETSGGGTARYVDSSMERLQILVREFDPQRYAVAVNGWEVPLAPTDTAGVHVAGVRYRAWQPPSCLHPAVPVDAPLTVDLYDRWDGRAISGCTYHVVHPGGRAFATFPVNAFEAESRRHARFQPWGHTPGAYELRRPKPNRDWPCTLDLRQQDRTAAAARGAVG